MLSEEKKPVFWFAIGLLATLLVCFCLAGGILGVGLLGTSIHSYFTTEMVGQGSTSEQTSEMEGVSQNVISSEAFDDMLQADDVDLDMAYETRDLLSDTIVPESDPISLAQRLKGIGDVPRVVSESADPISIGTMDMFWITDNRTGESSEIVAELVYATDHVYFWVEEGVDYEYEDVANLVDTFENEIYPTNRAFFGTEWSPGVDGDEHLYILCSRGLGYSIAGLYGSIDEYTSQVHPYTNAHEIFYISADALTLDEQYTYGVLAHEFQHMIHWYRDSNENTWMNEGFAEYAAILNGYDVGGVDYVFTSDPDIILDYWPSDESSSAHYGQAFLFITYFLDRFGSETTQELIGHPANGLDSVDQVLESLAIFDLQTEELVAADDVFKDWSVALWLQDPSIADGRYSYESYDPPFPSPSDTINDCPLSGQVRQINQYGIDYIRFTCPGNYRGSFEGLQSVQVVPQGPHSGEYAFWTNRGDTSDMTLTRAFDFSELDGDITFDYWVWYDIEEDWDYLYLQASTDDGETWQILETPSGTDANPTGNSYGWGYTGPSGSEGVSEWIQESVDLSVFAGQQVLLRFEYVTDAAVNGEGLLLDDLSIEAIDYEEDFESGDGGWESAGFVRLFNHLPQTYHLVLIETGDEIRVRDISLDEAQSAEFELSIGGDYDEAVLIVIGTARHTWQPSYYRFMIRP